MGTFLGLHFLHFFCPHTTKDRYYTPTSAPLLIEGHPPTIRGSALKGAHPDRHVPAGSLCSPLKKGGRHVHSDDWRPRSTG